MESDSSPSCTEPELLPYSFEMCSSLRERPTELDALIRRFQERRWLIPLKARVLKGLGTELAAVYALGLPWKEIWRTLQDAGYQGTYRQFVRMTTRLTREPLQEAERGKNLSTPRGEKRVHQAVVQMDDRKTEDKEKPEWQRRREETMARLDREAEETREREARLSRPKKFSMTPFVGRGEE